MARKKAIVKKNKGSAKKKSSLPIKKKVSLVKNKGKIKDKSNDKKKKILTGAKRAVLKKRVLKKRTPKKRIEKQKEIGLHLKKSSFNPIIRPNSKNSWESWQTFNPSAVYLDKKVHFLYRAIGEGGLSVLGYASSKDGIKVEEREKKPAYFLKEEDLIQKESEKNNYFPYCSGGSISGCEDPRMTAIEDRIYMTHTSFSNWSFLRITLTSINKKDFLKKKWDKWKKPVFISPPCEVHKNWVIFPEKINGKFAILHSISPNVLVDFFDSLNFDGKTFIKSHYSPEAPKKGWEAYLRGIGAPPIKTNNGWLVFYHAVERKDLSRYKIGVMMLDLKDPRKILYKAKEPVLEPDSHYENNGFKPGIVYSCGAVVINGELFVYYGGADSVVCVATANLKDFVNSLVKKEKPKFKKRKKIKK